MTRLHGAKAYYQILLDPHRAELLERLAEERGMRTTALAREMLYSAMKRLVGASDYGLAEAQDHAQRLASIQNQVRGRSRP